MNLDSKKFDIENRLDLKNELGFENEFGPENEKRVLIFLMPALPTFNAGIRNIPG